MFIFFNTKLIFVKAMHNLPIIRSVHATIFYVNTALFIPDTSPYQLSLNNRDKTSKTKKTCNPDESGMNGDLWLQSR